MSDLSCQKSDQKSDLRRLMSGVWFLMWHVWCHMSDVSYVIYVWCLMSDVWCVIYVCLMRYMCDDWCQTSDLKTYNRHLTSDVWCIMSYVKCHMSYVWCLMSEICVMSDVTCLMSYVLCLVSDVWDMCDVWCHVSYVRRLCDMYDIWSETVDLFVRCQISDVRRLISDVWCQMFYVRCETSDMWYMYDVWCQTFDVWYKYVWCETFDVWYVWCLMSDVWSHDV